MKDAKFVRIDEDGRHIYHLPGEIHHVDIKIDISEEPEMIEVKTADLIGPALDWAVAKVESLPALIYPGDSPYIYIDLPGRGCGPYHPSHYWLDGGPLLKEYAIEFEWVTDATIRAFTMIDSGVGFGSDHLVAACRAIVAAKLGDTVSVPKELVQ